MVKWWTCWEIVEKIPTERVLPISRADGGWVQIGIHNLLWNPKCILPGMPFDQWPISGEHPCKSGFSSSRSQCMKWKNMDTWTADMQLKNMALGSIEPFPPEVQAWCLPGGLISTPAVSVLSTSWKVLLALVSLSTIKATSRRWINLQAKFFWHWRTVALPSAKCKKTDSNQ